MDGKLTDIPTGKLLDKFGAGNHKPGSGSASALQGMLSAKMLCTVIDLTNEPKRVAAYAAVLPELLSLKSAIDTRIYPTLEALFQQDSEEFDLVIRTRAERDRETDPLKKRILTDQAQQMLKPATEVPLRIAELCLELAGFAVIVFDNGFKSARGDAGVALNCALAAIASCLSIAELNLASIPPDNWMPAIITQKKAIRQQYEELIPKSAEGLNSLEQESAENINFYNSIAEFRQGNLGSTIRSDADIESLARRLQNMLWVQKSNIWKHGAPEYTIEVLQPGIVLKKVLGYTFLEDDSLGIYEHGGELFETAGLIDKSQKLVRVSKAFPTETQAFTAAHELGHAILHNQPVLHRDRPLDGSAGIAKSLEETQADRFAAYFLMPAKLVKEVFFEIFEMPAFVINENTALAMRISGVGAFRQRCPDRRALSRLVAAADYFAGKAFIPISKIFRVSIEAMAIRLEELSLINF